MIVFFSRDVNYLSKWCCDNKMSLNVSKRHNLIFKLDYTSHKTFIGEYELSEPDREKVLRIIAWKNLTWSANCEHRVSKAKGALFQIKQNWSNSSSLSSKTNAYCGYILPIISYGSEVWKPNKSELRGIEGVQTKATRWILSSSALPYKRRHEKFRLLSLS